MSHSGRPGRYLDHISTASARASRPDTLPRPLGAYLLLDRLGQGGMGEVFLAKRAGLEGIEQHCVVKAVRADKAGHTELIGRFIDEAAVLVNLNHRNICSVTQVGRSGDDLFLAMELIAGRTIGEVLAELLRREQRLGEALALTILCETLSALDYAHRLVHPVTGEPMHIIHRDVSPQNVMLSYEGEVKLIDFGLARSSLKREMTAGGVRLGKVAYMSPEQLRSEPVDETTDQYAAAVVGYELLIGRRFYLGLEGDALFQAAGRGGHVPVYWKELDPRLQHILSGALSPDRSKRYPSCTVLKKEIQAYMLDKKLAADADDVRQLMARLFPTGPSELRTQLQAFASVAPPKPGEVDDEWEDVSSASGEGVASDTLGDPETHILLSNPHVDPLESTTPGEVPDAISGLSAISLSSEQAFESVPDRVPVARVDPQADATDVVRQDDPHTTTEEQPEQSSSVPSDPESSYPEPPAPVRPHREPTVRIARAEFSEVIKAAPRGPSKLLYAAGTAVVALLLVTIVILLLPDDEPGELARSSQPPASKTSDTQLPGTDAPDEKAPGQGQPASSQATASQTTSSQASDDERAATALATAPLEREDGAQREDGIEPEDGVEPDDEAVPGDGEVAPEPEPDVEPAAASTGSRSEKKRRSKSKKKKRRSKPKAPAKDYGPKPKVSASPTFGEVIKVLKWCTGQKRCASKSLGKLKQLRAMDPEAALQANAEARRCVAKCLR